MTWTYQYPHIPLLLSMKPSIRILLGQRLFWTEKKDGHNMAIWLEAIPHKTQLKGFKADKENWIVNDEVHSVQISSHKQQDASSDLRALVKRCDEYPKILDMLHENPQFVVYVEACRKGRSITGAEEYDRDTLFVIDIFDKSAEKFLPYVNTHQHCYHREVPVVKLWAETRHRSVKDLLKWKNHALEYSEATHLEGMVIKAYKIDKELLGYFKEFRNGLIQAKVKLDVPEPIQRKIAKGQPIYPPIPENEILGAIDKAWQELGTEKFRDVRLAMPLIAKMVGEECKKHQYSSPKKQLFGYYQQYLERLMDET